MQIAVPAFCGTGILEVLLKANERRRKQEIRLRKCFVIALGLASSIAFAGSLAFADCRSANAACVKGASSPFDSVACGSLYRTCAANQAIAAQQQAKQKYDAGAAMQNMAHPANPGHSGRR